MNVINIFKELASTHNEYQKMKQFLEGSGDSVPENSLDYVKSTLVQDITRYQQCVFLIIWCVCCNPVII